MNRLTADLPSNHAATAGFLYRHNQPWIGADDLRTVTLTFVATGLVMLIAASGLDCLLVSVVLEGAHSLDALAWFRLASDLLPLALAFTAVVTLVTGVAVIFARTQAVGETELGRPIRASVTVCSRAVGFA